MQRLYQRFITNDLRKKMVFIGGPRQVGKTTLCRDISALPPYKNHSRHLNWDSNEDRAIITKKQWESDLSLVTFDELHKHSRWKQWIKGVYDTKPKHQQYVVTGSARLDVYKRGGDSLLGRYHYWRIHPLTIDELPAKLSTKEAMERLLTLGGFPEPFLENDAREANRWRQERFSRILREDVRDLTFIRDLRLLELFADSLRERAGQLLVLSNLAQDLQISPITAKTWLELMERMYLGFAIYPLLKNVPRSIQKPPKFYFYDNADIVNDIGARLENLVATTLLKRLHFMEDYHGNRAKLHYIRDRSNREVDFVTVVDGKVIDLIEVKHADTEISASLRYYQKQLNPKRTTQLVYTLKKSYENDGILVTTPTDFFTNRVPFSSLYES